MKTKEALFLGLRYFLLIVFGAFNLTIFYWIFTPLTVQPVFWILKLIDPNAQLLIGNVLFFKGFYAEIIPACVAGAAYYLLLILNLSSPMNIIKRIKSLAFIFGVFLVLNILRIVSFLNLWKNAPEFFNEAHLASWYFGSTILLVIVWFVNVLLFKIDSIPIYTDIKNIFNDISSNAPPNVKKKNKK